MLWTYL
jgi:hypothetical protein